MHITKFKISVIIIASALCGIAIFSVTERLIEKYITGKQKKKIITELSLSNLQSTSEESDTNNMIMKYLVNCSKQYGPLNGEGYSIFLSNTENCKKLLKEQSSSIVINNNGKLFFNISRFSDSHEITFFNKHGSISLFVRTVDRKPVFLSYDAHDDSGELISSTFDTNWDGQADKKAIYGENRKYLEFKNGIWQKIPAKE